MSSREDSLDGQLAQEELDKQNLQLQQEIWERQQAERQLQEKAQQLIKVAELP